MAKTNLPNGTPNGGNGQSTPNYAYKPKKIGAIIKTLMVVNYKSKKELAAFTKVTVRVVGDWFHFDFISIPRMLQLSEFFGENLLLRYHPNVKPLPNPLQEELDKVKGYVKHLEGVELKYEKVLMENKSLRDQIDLLKEMLLEKNSRQMPNKF